MPVVRYNQSSFAGGEYSPEVSARVDIDRYKIGLKTCRNTIVHPHGGISNRGGTRLIARTKTQDKPSRMIKFIFSTTQVYRLEVGDFYIRFYKDRAQIQASGVSAYAGGTAYVVGNFVTYGGNTYYCIQAGTGHQPDISPTYWTVQTAYEIPTPYAYADRNDLRFEESADVIYITHKSYKQKTLTRFGDANWVLADYTALDGPFLNENTDVNSSITTNATTGSVIIGASKDIFNAQHIGALWRKTDYVPGQIVSPSFTGTGVSGSISCFTTWRLITHGTWTGKFQVEKSTDGGSTWTMLQAFSSANDFNANTSETEDTNVNTLPFLIRINCTSLSSGTLNIDLSSLAFYQDGILQITAFTDTKHVVATVIQTLASIAASISWAEGAWSDYRGYPSVCRFYQDRLVFGGSPNNPDTDWLTASGDYTSFIRSTPLLDSDGITVNLTSRQLNAINGLVAFKALLILTSSASWSIQPVSGASLTPTTVDQEVEEYFGSDGIEPVVIGNEAIFVQTHAKIVRSIVYQFAYNGFVGSEINIFARHLLKDWSVIDMCYQQNPDSIVWFLRSDGQLLGLTYMKEQDVVAWHHHDTNGTVESICCAPGNGYDEVWMTVNRPNGRFVEVMEDRLIEDVRKSFFVDCGLSSADNPLTITGVTQANPGVMHIPSHGLTTGDIITIDSIVGMVKTPSIKLNGSQYAVTVVDVNYVQLKDAADDSNIDTTAYSAYVSGGYARKCFTTFSGFDHFNGQTISILGDGFVFPQQVVASGQITLTRACALVSGGFQFESDVETLPVELSAFLIPSPPSTTQGRKVKIGEVTIRFVDSRGGWLGPAEFDKYGNLALKERYIPSRQTVNSVIDLFTGDARFPLGGGYETGARVFYRQYDPLPFTIVSIIPEIVVGGATDDGAT